MATCVSVKLSGRAECTGDVSNLFVSMLQEPIIQPFIASYACNKDQPLLGFYPRFDIAFVAPESKRKEMHGAIKRLVDIMERQDDAHVCLQTLDFTEAFDKKVDDDTGDRDYDETGHLTRVVARLEEHTAVVHSGF